MKNYRECSYTPCDRQARRKGLCEGHGKQKRRGKELTPLKARRKVRLCRFPDCGLEHEAKGYCHTHYQQRKTGRELSPIRDYNHWEDGYKVCPRCGENKHKDSYGNHAGLTNDKQSYCRECRKWLGIQTRYNLTREEWEGILSFQGNRCGVCGEDDSGSVYGFYVDHDHSCCSGRESCGKCLRGIICHGCNLRVDRKNDAQYEAYKARHEARGIPLVDLVMNRFDLTA